MTYGPNFSNVIPGRYNPTQTPEVSVRDTSPTKRNIYNILFNYPSLNKMFVYNQNNQRNTSPILSWQYTTEGLLSASILQRNVDQYSWLLEVPLGPVTDQMVKNSRAKYLYLFDREFITSGERTIADGGYNGGGFFIRNLYQIRNINRTGKLDPIMDFNIKHPYTPSLGTINNAAILQEHRTAKGGVYLSSMGNEDSILNEHHNEHVRAMPIPDNVYIRHPSSPVLNNPEHVNHPTALAKRSVSNLEIGKYSKTIISSWPHYQLSYNKNGVSDSPLQDPYRWFRVKTIMGIDTQWDAPTLGHLYDPIYLSSFNDGISTRHFTSLTSDPRKLSNLTTFLDPEYYSFGKYNTQLGILGGTWEINSTGMRVLDKHPDNPSNHSVTYQGVERLINNDYLIYDAASNLKIDEDNRVPNSWDRYQDGDISTLKLVPVLYRTAKVSFGNYILNAEGKAVPNINRNLLKPVNETDINSDNVSLITLSVYADDSYGRRRSKLWANGVPPYNAWGWSPIKFKRLQDKEYRPVIDATSKRNRQPVTTHQSEGFISEYYPTILTPWMTDEFGYSQTNIENPNKLVTLLNINTNYINDLSNYYYRFRETPIYRIKDLMTALNITEGREFNYVKENFFRFLEDNLRLTSGSLYNRDPDLHVSINAGIVLPYIKYTFMGNTCYFRPRDTIFADTVYPLECIGYLPWPRKYDWNNPVGNTHHRVCHQTFELHEEYKEQHLGKYWYENIKSNADRRNWEGLLFQGNTDQLLYSRGIEEVKTYPGIIPINNGRIENGVVVGDVLMMFLLKNDYRDAICFTIPEGTKLDVVYKNNQEGNEINYYTILTPSKLSRAKRVYPTPGMLRRMSRYCFPKRAKTPGDRWMRYDNTSTNFFMVFIERSGFQDDAELDDIFFDPVLELHWEKGKYPFDVVHPLDNPQATSHMENVERNKVVKIVNPFIVTMNGRQTIINPLGLSTSGINVTLPINLDELIHTEDRFNYVEQANARAESLPLTDENLNRLFKSGVYDGITVNRQDIYSTIDSVDKIKELGLKEWRKNKKYLLPPYDLHTSNYTVPENALWDNDTGQWFVGDTPISEPSDYREQDYIVGVHDADYSQIKYIWMYNNIYINPRIRFKENDVLTIIAKQVDNVNTINDNGYPIPIAIYKSGRWNTVSYELISSSTPNVPNNVLTAWNRLFDTQGFTAHHGARKVLSNSKVVNGVRMEYTASTAIRRTGGDPNDPITMDQERSISDLVEWVAGENTTADRIISTIKLREDTNYYLATMRKTDAGYEVMSSCYRFNYEPGLSTVKYNAYTYVSDLALIRDNDWAGWHNRENFDLSKLSTRDNYVETIKRLLRKPRNPQSYITSYIKTNKIVYNVDELSSYPTVNGIRVKDLLYRAYRDRTNTDIVIDHTEVFDVN